MRHRLAHLVASILVFTSFASCSHEAEQRAADATKKAEEASLRAEAAEVAKTDAETAKSTLEKEVQDLRARLNAPPTDAEKKLAEITQKSAESEKRAEDLGLRLAASERTVQTLTTKGGEDRDWLRKQLAGTTWNWQKVAQFRFRDDGTVQQPSWEERVTTRWEPVDRRTVVFFIERGRTTDRIALLSFAEDLQEYSGYDFDGSRLARGEKVP
jgi:hypothetical protein